MKLAIITCYKQPDYVRAQTLRAAAAQYPGIELIIVKNRHTGILRYPEIFWKTLALRFKQHPDAYLLTFRAYEILPWLAVTSWPKTLIYDEFVNPLEWLNEPQAEWWVRLVPKTLLRAFYRLLLKRCRIILADTEAHAASSRQLSNSQAKYYALPVSTDETVFKPAPHKPNAKFQVFYYGNMRPLHGLPHVLEAAISLKDQPIEFLIVGGGPATKDSVVQAKQQGANITSKTWIPFKQLPGYIHQADLCLGGPFGDTAQARQVITGKTYQFLASARPTIVGQGQAISQFADKQNCLLVPLGDAPALAEAIAWAVGHPAQLAQIAQQGRQLYQKSFSQAEVARQLTAILTTLA
jgi:glycosyltransferase involved in cell wall biosynthesis